MPESDVVSTFESSPINLHTFIIEKQGKIEFYPGYKRMNATYSPNGTLSGYMLTIGERHTIYEAVDMEDEKCLHYIEADLPQSHIQMALGKRVSDVFQDKPDFWSGEELITSYRNLSGKNFLEIEIK